MRSLRIRIKYFCVYFSFRADFLNKICILRIDLHMYLILAAKSFPSGKSIPDVIVFVLGIFSRYALNSQVVNEQCKLGKILSYIKRSRLLG